MNCFYEVQLDLPIVSTTDYQLASSVKLDIEYGRNLISGVVSMAKDGLHALKLRVLVQVYSLLDVRVCLAEMRVQPSKETSPVDVLFL